VRLGPVGQQADAIGDRVGLGLSFVG